MGPEAVPPARNIGDRRRGRGYGRGRLGNLHRSLRHRSRRWGRGSRNRRRFRGGRRGSRCLDGGCDDIVAGIGPYAGRRPDGDRQRHDQRRHTDDENRRQDATEQGERLFLVIFVAEHGGHRRVLAGVAAGEIVGDGAVGQEVGTRFRVGSDLEVTGRYVKGVYDARAGILCPGLRRGGRHKQSARSPKPAPLPWPAPSPAPQAHSAAAMSPPPAWA